MCATTFNKKLSCRREAARLVSYLHSITTMAVCSRFDTIHERNRHAARHRRKARAARSRGKSHRLIDSKLNDLVVFRQVFGSCSVPSDINQCKHDVPCRVLPPGEYIRPDHMIFLIIIISSTSSSSITFVAQWLSQKCTGTGRMPSCIVNVP